MTRVGLNADVILEAALELVDVEGLDALTMRRLAGRLGVAPMSLYGHVPNKDDLLTGMVNLVTREIVLPDPGTPPWEALRAIIREFRRVAHLHPNLVPLFVRQPPTGAAGLLTLEVALDALRRAGMGPGTAVRAYRLLASFAIGFVSLECGGFFRPVDVAAGDHASPADPAALPRIAEMASELGGWDADEEFHSGVDALLEVLRRAGLSPDAADGRGDGGRRPPPSPR